MLKARTAPMANTATTPDRGKTLGVLSLLAKHVPGTHTDEDKGTGDREHRQTRAQAHSARPVGEPNMAEPEV
jgi:hypothetical protein